MSTNCPWGATPDSELVANPAPGGVPGAGTVIGTGTGAAFSLLPAQNATGNWLKIVQRVPVRIALNGDMVKTHPLPLGTSLAVTVDTSDRDGPRLTAAPSPRPVDVTATYGYWRAGGQDMVDRIIAENLPTVTGSEPPPTAPSLDR